MVGMERGGWGVGSWGLGVGLLFQKIVNKKIDFFLKINLRVDLRAEMAVVWG
jgi:hypothetical protein